MDGAAAAGGGVLEPMVGTFAALCGLIVEAEASTGLFAFVLLILSLEFLREAKGFFVPVGRAAVLGSLVFSACYAAYGDFLLEPAKSVLTQIPPGPARYPEAPWLAAGLGAAGVGIGFYAGQRACAPMSKKVAVVRPHSGRTAIGGQRGAGKEDSGLTSLPSNAAAALRMSAFQRLRNRKKAVCPTVKRSAPRPAARLRGQARTSSGGSL